MTWLEKCLAVKNSSFEEILTVMLAQLKGGTWAGAKPKTISGGVRIKKIKCLGQKKFYFLLHELYFSANQWGARIPADTYLHAATVHGGFEYGEQNQEGKKILNFIVAYDLMIVNTFFRKEKNI
jgi:hypothetical protein